MATNFEKLQKLLEELFQLDQADLDFGIYRIMNQKRDEVVRFLEKDLLPQVKEAFGQYQSADRVGLQAELDKLVAQITSAGMNPDDSPKVQGLRQQMADSSVDVGALENEVFSHLFNFFRRYYHEGDFISLRRYKEGVYAIPYEGEEVKLHWANHDQYYVKSSEYFRDYVFTMPSGKRVRVHLVAASSEQDNKKEQAGKERRFIICKDSPITEENGELFIRFEYRSDDGKTKQDALNQQAIERVLKSDGIDEWVRELGKPAPTKSNPNRTVLEKHLTQYTARNTFDYFIHKDLGGFLRRELDFYIKNEVMHLDDIEHDTVPRVEQYLSKIKVIRKIAHKIILFLEQIENFQKRLWLKKKFVVESNYCITLDRIPEHLYPEIAANNEQRIEWVRLFAIDEIKDDLLGRGYTEPLTPGFLIANKKLSLNTRWFSERFTEQLLASIDNLDAQTDGIVLHGDNFHGLALAGRRLKDTVKCVYIDPPYNKGDDGFCFKDSYQHASWMSMMHDRLTQCHPLLDDDGVLYASIDDAERNGLEAMLSNVFGAENRVEEVIWAQNTRKNQSPTFSTNHEYVEVFAKNLSVVKKSFEMFREVKPGFVEIMTLMQELNPTYPPVLKLEAALKGLFKARRQKLKKENISVEEDEWKSIYTYNRCEYRTEQGRYVDENKARSVQAKVWVWREVDTSMPQVKEDSQKAEFRDPNSPVFRFYKPIHPITGLHCKIPATGWRWPYEAFGNQANYFTKLDADNRIVWGENENKVPQQKSFLHEVETVVAKSVVTDYADGETTLTALFGKSRSFSNPKPVKLVQRFCSQAAIHEKAALDFFAGSGTTAEAVIALNRADGGSRKYVLIEQGDYCSTIIIPRIMKVLYSAQWKDGKPLDREGLSHCLRYQRLESYDDALNNLKASRSEMQTVLLEEDDQLREQYFLSYMLDLESSGSQSLLNLAAFRNPQGYKLNVQRNGETQIVNVDLVETFNWLLGISVSHIDLIRGVKVVDGVSPDNERVIVLWRNLDETDNDALDQWFAKQDYNTKEQVYDLFYVNGDNNLENLRRSDQTWKVRLIEQEFARLMFEVENV